MSVMWVARFTSHPARWDRSPTPVSVGAYTSCPAARRARATPCQHQPPAPVPCTSTKVVT